MSVTRPVSPTTAISWRYRLQQFWRGLHAEVTADEIQRAVALLPGPAGNLFCAMPVDAQRHSLNVLASLGRAGQSNADLAAAALLHDVGKIAAQRAGYPLGLWWRGPLVLLEALAPQLLPGLACADPASGWRYVVYVQLNHPAIGATWADEAGCSWLTCWLIAHHQEQTPPNTDPARLALLQALQWADGKN